MTVDRQRRNKFAAVCTSCGKRVAPGDGLTTKSADDKWLVAHVDCDKTMPTPEAPNKYDFTRRGRRKFVGLNPW